jgi:hypothetical protein
VARARTIELRLRSEVTVSTLQLDSKPDALFDRCMDGQSVIRMDVVTFFNRVFLDPVFRFL